LYFHFKSEDRIFTPVLCFTEQIEIPAEEAMRRKNVGILVPAVMTWLVLIAYAQAQSYQEILLHSFNGGADGENPMASLILDAAGNLYGTTYGGGINGKGTVFRIDSAGNETVLYSFKSGADGQNPAAPLILVAGELYGTTQAGGGSGDGTVFQLSSSGQETVLYSFHGGADGAYPSEGVVRDSAGNLYGATSSGGASGLGTVFKLAPGNIETLLHSFGEATDGKIPLGGLIRDNNLNLYGTTQAGGTSGWGTAYRISAAGAETILYSFPDQENATGVIRDVAGNLYGSTTSGGRFGDGTVFKIDSTGKKTVLHSFKGGSDGAYPSAGLIQDAAGNLYGTTYGGGRFNWGTVFKIDSTGKESILHSFTAGSDGASPVAGLVQDGAGNLYGTTKYGGAYGAGTVFELKIQ
jgi:uncharacterized repeat protein (TIGR03803 family)